MCESRPSDLSFSEERTKMAVRDSRDGFTFTSVGQRNWNAWSKDKPQRQVADGTDRFKPNSLARDTGLFMFLY